MAGILLNRNRQVPAEETPAFGGIAERFRRAGDLDRAIALCRDGLKRFPDQLSARVTLGWSFLDKGQYDAARAELEQVLRKAPDNLAAIRGLAELHDRSEGAISSAEQESWRNAAAHADAVSETDAESAVAHAEAANLAPIQVDLAAMDEQSPEVVHTAAQTAFTVDDAASAFSEPAADLIVAPVELEDAAAASMAAAVEPAPFVVDPIDTTADISSIEAFDADDVDLLTEAASAMEIGITDPAAEMLLDAAQAADIATWDDATGLAAAIDAEPDLVLDAIPAVEVESALTAAAAWNAGEAEIEPAPVAALETLEDVDEEAGMELADAIKALEEATRRVEAKFAIPPVSIEPAAGAEEIAAFEFLDSSALNIADEADAAIDDAVQPIIDARHDGSFELVAPDLKSLELDAADVAVETPESNEADDVDADAIDAYPAALAFDAVLEDALPIEADTAPAAAVDADIVVADAEGDIEAAVALLEEQAAELASMAGSAEPPAAAEAEESEGVADGGDATRVIPFIRPGATAPVEVEAQHRLDTEVAVDAAVAADAEQAPDEVDAQIAALIATDAAEVVTTVFTGAAVVEEEHTSAAHLVDAVAESEAVSPAVARRRKTLAALERFLRQVQARQLELRSETVA